MNMSQTHERLLGSHPEEPFGKVTDSMGGILPHTPLLRTHEIPQPRQIYGGC